MAIRLRRGSLADNPEVTGDDLIVQETEYEGQRFAWGPGEKRSFADDGIAVAHRNYSADDDVAEDSRDQGSRS